MKIWKMINSFLQRKQDILNKSDKSNIGEWDKKIVKLCQRINKLDDYYTTSSCSGRVMIIVDQEKKAADLFQFVSHDKIKLKTIMNGLPRIGDFKFKQEPMILHIACKDIISAQGMLRKVRGAGFKRAGIISFGKTIVIEVIGTEKIEFPLIKKGKLLVDEDFLKIVIKKSNENLKRNWKKIGKLRKSL